MFKKISQLLRLSKTIEEKEQILIEVETKIFNKEKIITETILEARQSVQEEANGIITNANNEAIKILEDSKRQLLEYDSQKEQKEKEIIAFEESISAIKQEFIRLEKTSKKLKNESLGIKNLIEKFPEAINYELIDNELCKLEDALTEGGFLEPVVQLNLHYNDSKLLRKEMNVINKEIKTLLKNYHSRYTTKANITIYNLMVIGLQAELQNILFTLNYSNLEKALDNAKKLIEKYHTICGQGNAAILPTITRFLSELEPLFISAIQVEYKYYIQKEKEKEEQRLIKEQMRQEAEERKLLEMERKKIEKEEEKFLNEMAKNQDLLKNETDLDKIAALEARLKELEVQYQKLEEEKEEIVKRANGRAGYVYVISNLGSFGDNTFKIGMTRRLNPFDRIDELGDASVPFKFDVHAMIFSDNAVEMEQKLHQILEKERVNKVNLRKEFFNVDVEQLRNIVEEIDPTVEFTTTMAAQEYRQSLSLTDELISIA